MAPLERSGVQAEYLVPGGNPSMQSEKPQTG